MRAAGLLLVSEIFGAALAFGCADTPAPAEPTAPAPRSALRPKPWPEAHFGPDRIVIDVYSLPVVGVARNNGPLLVRLELECDGGVTAIERGDRRPAIAMVGGRVAGSRRPSTLAACPGTPREGRAVEVRAITLTPLPPLKNSVPSSPLAVSFHEQAISPIHGRAERTVWAEETVAASPIVPRIVYAFVRPARDGDVNHLAIVVPPARRVVVSGEPQREAVALTGDFTLIELPIQRGGAASAEASFALADRAALEWPAEVRTSSSADAMIDITVDLTFGLGDRDPLATLSISRRP